MGENLSQITNAAVLSFKDSESDWYTSRKKKITLHLKEFFEEFVFLRKIFCGQSSGGYAALLFGKKLNADLFIAFSPQIKNSFSGDGHMSPPIKIANLERTFSGKEGNIILILPKSENSHKDIYRWDDWWQIEEIRKRNNVVLVTLPCDYHAATIWLKKRNILYSYINSIIISGF